MHSEAVVSWCNRIIQWGFMFLVFLVPLILTPWNYELFEYNKMMTVYFLTVIIIGTWLFKMIAQREIRIARTPLDIPIVLFVASQLASALFSMDPHVSWFGYYSRFNGGMWSIFSYTLLFYAFVSNFQEFAPDRIGRFLKILMASATTVAVYGVAEHFGIDKHLWVQDVQARVFSTLGQPNWLAAFLVALLPIAMAFALRASSNHAPRTKSQTNSKSKIINLAMLDIGILNFGFVWNLRFVIWILISILLCITLLYTRSRSGLIGFAIADIVFWGMLFVSSFWSANRRIQNPSSSKKDAGQASMTYKQHASLPLHVTKIQKLISPFFILHFAFIILIFFNGTHVDFLDRYVTYKGLQNILNPTSNPESRISNLESTPSGTLLETGGTESGTIRTYVWQAAITAWQSSKKSYWIGTGTETFAFAFYQFKPKEHNLTSEWDFLYNKAHNEYLNYLATTGILGLGSYLLLIGMFIVWFMKVQSSWSKVQTENSKKFEPSTLNYELSTINYALFAGWLSILVTNFFGFSVVAVQLLFFLYPAIIIVSLRQRPDVSDQKTYSLSLARITFPNWVYTVFYLIVLLSSIILIFSLVLRWYADRLFASGYRLSRAGRITEAETFLERAILLNQTEPFYFDELGNVTATLSIAALENGDATAAANLADRAVRANRVALTISPHNVNYWKTRTKIYYTFANIDPSLTKAAITSLEQAHALSPQDPKILYNLAVLLGKDDKKTDAVDALKRAIVAKPNYRDAYIALSIFHTETKDKDKAKAILRQYLSLVDPADKEVIERLKE